MADWFHWTSDPNAWLGLATLIGLEIVLGVDNLVFTAILANRLPPGQRDRARLIGLLLALGMRLALLGAISWLAKLTAPLVTLWGFPFSGRDMILIAGGAFLLAKSVTELHERIEAGEHAAGEGRRATPIYWQVIAQIIALDLVFSLDSIITAVGMVDELSIMIIAVIVAVGVMIMASGPLTNFIGRRPTVVILCLGFLLMIGFSLITEGFGFHIPKAYLYAAILFSVGVETANELRRRNQTRAASAPDRRARASQAILRLLGGKMEDTESAPEAGTEPGVFRPDEQRMVEGVLALGERPLASLGTPRGSIEWIDAEMPPAAMHAQVARLVHDHVVVARGGIDQVIGVARTRDLLAALGAGPLDPAAHARAPVLLEPTLQAFQALEALKRAPVRVALVRDAEGRIQALLTPQDLLEAIAGEFREWGESRPDDSNVAQGGVRMPSET